MKEDKIWALLVKPGEQPYMVEIPHTLKDMQDAVGGTIQTVYPWDRNVVLVCDDEGKIKGKEPNRLLETESGVKDIICGPFFICGVSGEDFCSLTEAQAFEYEQLFHYPEAFVALLGGNRILRFKIGSGDPPDVI